MINLLRGRFFAELVPWLPRVWSSASYCCTACRFAFRFLCDVNLFLVIVPLVALELLIMFVTSIVSFVSSCSLDLELWAVVDSGPPLRGGGWGGGRGVGSYSIDRRNICIPHAH